MVSNQLSFPRSSEVENVPASAGDRGLIPGSGRSSGEGNGNPLWYSLLGESHRQRSLADYGPRSRKRVGLDLATKQQQHSDLTIKCSTEE